MSIDTIVPEGDLKDKNLQSNNLVRNIVSAFEADSHTRLSSERYHRMGKIEFHMSIPQDQSYDLIIVCKGISNSPSARQYFYNLADTIAQSNSCTCDIDSSLIRTDLTLKFKSKDRSNYIDILEN